MERVLIIGANRGIGLALAQRYRARGAAVIGTSRSPAPELAATGAEVIDGIDVVDEAAPANLAAALGERRFERLIVNAGILERDTLAELDPGAVRRQFEVNALAPLRFAALLYPRIVRGGKLGLVTSRMGSIADNGSGAYYGYRMSKAALNAAGRSLAIDLKPHGIAVFLLHPGFVRTRMTQGQGDVDPDTAARGLIERLDHLGLEHSGSFWHANGQALPW
jgi:NAD(P)-dependent dehydrogenase (short-subunit alcohol dehydrogenase family)